MFVESGDLGRVGDVIADQLGIGRLDTEEYRIIGIIAFVVAFQLRAERYCGHRRGFRREVIADQFRKVQIVVDTDGEYAVLRFLFFAGDGGDDRRFEHLASCHQNALPCFFAVLVDILVDHGLLLDSDEVAIQKGARYEAYRRSGREDTRKFDGDRSR